MLKRIDVNGKGKKLSKSNIRSINFFDVNKDKWLHNKMEQLSFYGNVEVIDDKFVCHVDINNQEIMDRLKNGTVFCSGNELHHLLGSCFCVNEHELECYVFDFNNDEIQDKLKLNFSCFSTNFKNANCNNKIRAFFDCNNITFENMIFNDNIDVFLIKNSTLIFKNCQFSADIKIMGEKDNKDNKVIFNNNQYYNKRMGNNRIYIDDVNHFIWQNETYTKGKLDVTIYTNKLELDNVNIIGDTLFFDTEDVLCINSNISGKKENKVKVKRYGQ